MKHMRNLILKLRRDEEGATAVEYGVMVALIAAVIVAIVLLLGRQVQAGFCNTSYELNEAEKKNVAAEYKGGPAADECDNLK